MKRDHYHYGDLRGDLVDTTISLLEERGVQAFSMAEASRRLGVAASAPYRHFPDRDALLRPAAAVRASRLLSERLARDASAGTPTQQLADVTRAYIYFAAEQRTLFQFLISSGFEKSRYPDVEHAAHGIEVAFMTPARSLASDEAAAQLLVSAIVAAAHGYAVLMVGDANLDPARVAFTAGQAVRSTRALIAGLDIVTGET